MSRFKISQEQKDEYFTKGFTAIRKAVNPELLIRLQNMSDTFEDNIINEYKNGKITPESCVSKNGNSIYLSRFNNIHSIDWDTTLDLLASPPMMAIFRDICGKGAVPLQIDLLFKRNYNESVVLWHQDSLYNRKYPYINVGIYLDDSNKDDGALLYVPNTQHEKQDISKLSQKYGWSIPNSVEFPAKAGDINVHDMMVLHGSKPKKTRDTRRTIYVEIRPFDGILESNSQTKQWADLRKRFMGLVLRRANPEDWPEEWKADYPSDLKSDKEEIENIMNLREAPTPANYAIFPVEHENYPVANDFR